MIITKEQFIQKSEFFLREMKKGKIFIYPTDTIYGIGCDATNAAAVRKIREIKQRDLRPFSIIIPNKKWIKENCILSKIHAKNLKKLPGPFTLILTLKNKNIISKEVNAGSGTIGVRIPDNWFSQFLQKNKVLFVTTSVNLQGQSFLTDLKELSKEISNQVDYIIDSGPLNGKPSTVIDLTQKDERVLRK